MPTLDELQALYNLPSLALGATDVVEWTTDGHRNVIGAQWRHYYGDNPCLAYLWFDTQEGQPLNTNRTLHHVVAWQPLSITPGVQCDRCGRAGTVQQGNFVEG